MMMDKCLLLDHVRTAARFWMKFGKMYSCRGIDLFLLVLNKAISGTDDISLLFQIIVSKYFWKPPACNKYDF